MVIVCLSSSELTRPSSSTAHITAQLILQDRKGWDILLRAYLHEFTPRDQVELHIVTHTFGRQKVRPLLLPPKAYPARGSSTRNLHLCDT